MVRAQQGKQAKKTDIVLPLTFRHKTGKEIAMKAKSNAVRRLEIGERVHANAKR